MTVEKLRNKAIYFLHIILTVIGMIPMQFLIFSPLFGYSGDGIMGNLFASVITIVIFLTFPANLAERSDAPNTALKMLYAGVIVQFWLFIHSLPSDEKSYFMITLVSILFSFAWYYFLLNVSQVIVSLYPDWRSHNNKLSSLKNKVYRLESQIKEVSILDCKLCDTFFSRYDNIVSILIRALFTELGKASLEQKVEVYEDTLDEMLTLITPKGGHDFGNHFERHYKRTKRQGGKLITKEVN